MKNIVINKLCKSYEDKQIFKDLSLTIPFHKTTAIMAPSGKGKTTLLRLLMGLEPLDSGEIEGIYGLKRSAVFQEDRLCENLNPVANIKLVNPALGDDEILFGIKSMVLSGCETQPVSELSGGMKRRVAILRAMLASWDILFLDEPFKGLDKDTKQLVMDEVKKQCENRTVILVTHSIDEVHALNCDNIIQL